jgi:hypothetical protein|tara:strand:- start:194 stop:595 length:402 start_codon:yes stop_codon:yes gene_type:complete
MVNENHGIESKTYDRKTEGMEQSLRYLRYLWDEFSGIEIDHSDWSETKFSPTLRLVQGVPYSFAETYSIDTTRSQIKRILESMERELFTNYDFRENERFGLNFAVFGRHPRNMTIRVTPWFDFDRVKDGGGEE